MAKLPFHRQRNPSREFVIIVGAPSDTFAGYFVRGTKTRAAKAQPAPKNASVAEIRKYMLGDPPILDINNQDKPITHDKYWANFIYAAVKLVETRQIAPDPGDIVTIIFWLPGYMFRQVGDFGASPYNPARGPGAWVPSPPFPYDDSFRRNEQGKEPPGNAFDQTNSATRPPGRPPAREEDIDHEILMRSTDEQNSDGGFGWRPWSACDYIRRIHDIPIRIVKDPRYQYGFRPDTNRFDAAPLKRVAVKILAMQTKDELFAYLETGKWKGKEWSHYSDICDTWTETIPTEFNWHWAVNPPRTTYPDWESAPSVDRDRVKIHRLDYFGHSTEFVVPDSSVEGLLMLQYGWRNLKGELAGGEVSISQSDLGSHLRRDLFTEDSFAHLWGCHLGFGDQGMGPFLTQFISRVRYSEETVDYNFVLPSSDRTMPKPAVKWIDRAR